jgi:hypothetical protein
MAVQFGVTVLARAGLSAWQMPYREPEELKQLAVFHLVDMVVSSLLTYTAFKDFSRGRIEFGLALTLYRFASVTTALAATKQLCRKPIPFYKGIIMGVGATDVVIAVEIIRHQYAKKPITLSRIWY